MTVPELQAHLLVLCQGARRHPLIWDNLGLIDQALVNALERLLTRTAGPGVLATGAFLDHLLHEAHLSNSP